VENAMTMCSRIANFFYNVIKYLPFNFCLPLRAALLRTVLGGFGAGSCVTDGVTFISGPSITIGERVSINQHCYFVGGGGLTIGNDVLIAPYVALVTEGHTFTDTAAPMRQQANTLAPIVIEDDVWLAAGVTVTGGVTIGRGSVIGAGAVVTSDVEPFSVMGGVPAKLIRKRS